MNTHYRHGDLLLVQIDQIPETCQPRPGGVVLEGEATGHAHRVDSRAVVLRDRNGTLFVNAFRGTALTHEEHARIDLPAGFYRVVRQREYSPTSVRYVVD